MFLLGLLDRVLLPSLPLSNRGPLASSSLSVSVFLFALGGTGGWVATFSSARALLQWCRLESERDSASVEAGTLRRQLAGLRAESERAAQVCLFCYQFSHVSFEFSPFLRFLVFSCSRSRRVFLGGKSEFFAFSTFFECSTFRVFEFCRRPRGDNDRVLVAPPPPPRHRRRRRHAPCRVPCRRVRFGLCQVDTGLVVDS